MKIGESLIVVSDSPIGLFAYGWRGCLALCSLLLVVVTKGEEEDCEELLHDGVLLIV